jgi:hypothetical protein
VYRHCIFCQGDLGTNDIIEELPIGRRIAFDPAKGRLWVICRKCERWNLTPFDTRWEAIENCEKRFRATRLRVSTDNIGMARAGDGLELVRIGEPLRPEMAAWRYGDQFGRRRQRYFVMAGVGVAAVALVYGGLHLAIGAGGYWGWNGAWRGITDRIGRVKAPTEDGRIVNIVPSKAKKARIRIDPDGGNLKLSIKAGSRIEFWHNDEARVIAGIVLPKANMSGAGKSSVQAAVSVLGGIPAGDDPLLSLVGPRRKFGKDKRSLKDLATPQRLALEMALHEEQERRALQGELMELEQRWRAAEEIAGIADSLTVPDSVDQRFAALKAGSQQK